MLKIASCIYCLNKDISIAFNVIFISFRCAWNFEVIFYGNSPERPALGARYEQLSAINVQYFDYLQVFSVETFFLPFQTKISTIRRRTLFSMHDVDRFYCT